MRIDQDSLNTRSVQGVHLATPTYLRNIIGIMITPKQHDYESLHNLDNNSNLTNQRVRSSLTRWHNFLLFSALLIITNLCTLAVSHIPSKTPSISLPDTHQDAASSKGKFTFPCGRNYTEAIAAGCTFDVMMDEWLPEDCQDRELTAEFKALKDWQFYSDSNLIKPLSEEALAMSKVAYTTIEYHEAHCSFALRKLHRAIARGAKIERAVASEAHTTHCAELLRVESAGGKDRVSNRASSLEHRFTSLHPGFPPCVEAVGRYMA